MELISITESDILSITNVSLYIYGAGEFAKDVERLLHKYHREIVSFIVDDEYFDVSMRNTIPMSKYIWSEDDIVINAIANVKAFKRVRKDNVFPKLYLMFSPVKLWKIDDNIDLGESDYGKTFELYADELSKKTQISFLKAKQLDSAIEVIDTVFEEDIYFNSITDYWHEGAFVDCGAFNGDSVKKYIAFRCASEGECKGEIFAFEPDAINCNEMIKSFKGYSKVHCICKGVWDKADRLSFDAQGNMASSLTEAGNSNVVDVIDIDSIVGSEKIAFIKMDVEGSEKKALLGAQKCIKRDYPILAISAYHRAEDLIELPKLIKGFESEKYGYNLYLRHHGICAYELVLYAIPYEK